MKKCPKCNKRYDDSWGLCLICEVPLFALDLPSEEAEEIVIRADEERVSHKEPFLVSWFKPTIEIVISVICGTGLIYLFNLQDALPTLMWGLPSLIIHLLFFTPPLCFYFNMLINFLSIFLSIGIHAYTVIVAYREGLPKAVITLILPVISEIYWFIKSALRYQTVRNTYCMVLILYVLVGVLFYASIIIIGRRVRELKR